jgi:monoamine oxidase
MAKRMRAKLQPDSLINSAKVVQIVPVAPGDISSALMVSYQDLTQPTGTPVTQLQFDHVINTVPFGALRAIDLSALQLQWPLTSAIRELNYCNSGKIAMRFKERWWEKRYKLVGGFGKTDGPIRVCVYPAYGVKETEGATIIVSYTWDQDANVLGALAASPAALKGAPKDALKDVVFRDLNVLHGIEDDKVLPGLFLDMDAWNWADNAGTGGALFKFSRLQR